MAINYFENLGFGNFGERQQAAAQNAQAMRGNEQAMQMNDQAYKMNESNMQRQVKADEQAMLKFQNDQQKQRAAQGAGAFYQRLQAGDTQGALQIASQYEEDINGLGDPTFTTQSVAELMKTPQGVEQLKQMSLGMVQMAAGPDQFARFTAEQAKPMEPAKPASYQQGSGDLAGYVFNPETGEYKAATNVLQKIESARAAKQGGEEVGIKDVASLNKDITALVKDTDMIYRTSKDITKLKKLGGGPASISIVYKFMKSLDPTSVVREGEFATAANAGGIPENVLNVYNRLIEGERLPEKVIEDFEIAAAELANSSIDATSSAVDGYLETFDTRLPPRLKESLKGRVPQRIEIGKKDRKEEDIMKEYDL
jgi:hypothetical protein